MTSPAFSRLMPLLLLAALGCGPSRRSNSGTRPATSVAAAGRFEDETNCNVLGDLRCIKLSLPISGGDAVGRELVVTFAVHEGTQANREALLLIGGGPGEPVIESVSDWLPSIDPRLLEGRDVVTFDLRGAFQSGDHGCPEADDIWRQQTFTAKTPQQRLELLRAAKTFAFACAAELGIDAADLPYYNSVDAAHDIEAFRRIRGYDRWTIYAYSYGTQLAQIYAGLFPDRVKNMALDGAVDLQVSALDFDAQLVDAQNQILDQTLDQCLDRASCASLFVTSPREALLRLKSALNQDEPFAESALDALDPIASIGPDRRFIADNFDLYDLDLVASQAMHDEKGRAEFLRALSAFDRAGDMKPLHQLLYGTPTTHDQIPDSEKSPIRSDMGIYYLFICNDYGRGGLSYSERVNKFEALADHVEGGDFIIRSPGYSELPCMVWPSAPAIAPRLPPANNTVPTLLIAATMDAAVPFEQSLGLLGRSPNASLIMVEGRHHVMYGTDNDCVDDAVNVFLLSGEQPELKIQRCPA